MIADTNTTSNSIPTSPSISLRRFGLAVAAALAVLVLTALGGAASESVPAVASSLVPVSGVVVAVGDGALGLREDGATAPVAFPITAGSAFTRDGFAAAADELQPGDRVQMTVDGRTGAVLRADAAPVAAAFGVPSGETAALAALGLVGAGGLLTARRRGTSGPAANRRPGARTPSVLGWPPAAPVLATQRAGAGGAAERPRR